MDHVLVTTLFDGAVVIIQYIRASIAVPDMIATFLEGIERTAEHPPQAFVTAPLPLPESRAPNPLRRRAWTASLRAFM